MEKLTANQKLDLGDKYWGWCLALAFLAIVLQGAGLFVGGVVGFGFWAITLLALAAVSFVLAMVYGGLSLRDGYC